MDIAEQHYIGLDVGRTIRGALVRLDGSILQQQRTVSEVHDARVFVSQLTDVIKALRSSEHGDRAAGVGIGWAGLINQRAQRIEASPNIVDVSSYDLPPGLGRATGLP